MKFYKNAKGEFRGKMSEALAKLNKLTEIAADENVYVSPKGKLTVATKKPIDNALLSERPTSLHKVVNGLWADSVVVNEITDADGNEISFGVTDTDFVRVQQAQMAFEFGAKKVQIHFSTGQFGVFTKEGTDELMKMAFKIKAVDFVVE